MADPKILDELGKRQMPPAIPGGTKRPSLRANLREFPQVRRRQQLNQLLLANGCGNGGTVTEKFRPTDLALLIQIAHERSTNPLLRRQAIIALSQFRELDAAAALARLARSELEHESVRVSAQMALQTLSPDLSRAIEVQYQKAQIKSEGKKRQQVAPPKDKR